MPVGSQLLPSCNATIVVSGGNRFHRFSNADNLLWRQLYRMKNMDSRELLVYRNVREGSPARGAHVWRNWIHGELPLSQSHLPRSSPSFSKSKAQIKQKKIKRIETAILFEVPAWWLELVGGGHSFPEGLYQGVFKETELNPVKPGLCLTTAWESPGFQCQKVKTSEAAKIPCWKYKEGKAQPPPNQATFFMVVQNLFPAVLTPDGYNHLKIYGWMVWQRYQNKAMQARSLENFSVFLRNAN